MILTRCPLLCNYIARELQKTELKYCNLLCKTAKKKNYYVRQFFFNYVRKSVFFW